MILRSPRVSVLVGEAFFVMIVTMVAEFHGRRHDPFHPAGLVSHRLEVRMVLQIPCMSATVPQSS